MFVAVEAEGRSRAEYLAEVSGAFDQITTRAEDILDQDRVADHHHLPQGRQIDSERVTVTSAQSGNHLARRGQERNALDRLR